MPPFTSPQLFEHNTLDRALGRCMAPSILDPMPRLAKERKLIKRCRRKPLRIGSSLFGSRHFERLF